jgi:hypothetical protein
MNGEQKHFGLWPGVCQRSVMSDTDSIPEGKQGLTARMMHTILVYALEMPRVPTGISLLGQVRSDSAPRQDLQAGTRGVLFAGEHFEPDLPERALISCYGLNRQEAALAIRLVRGWSLQEAAAELGMTTEMAKVRFKRIFMKTELHSFLECSARPMPGTATRS